MSELPDDLRRDVVAEVYRQAGELDWEGLTDKQRSLCMIAGSMTQPSAVISHASCHANAPGYGSRTYR